MVVGEGCAKEEGERCGKGEGEGMPKEKKRYDEKNKEETRGEKESCVAPPGI